MKKILLTICALFVVFAAPLCAMEWGGLITNDTGAAIVTMPDVTNTTINQSNGVSVWFKNPIGEDFAVSGELLYKYKFSKPKDIDGTFTNIFDVPLLKVSGETEAGAGILSLDAGRFAYVDNAGAVVSGTIDGVAVEYSLPLVKLGVMAGYTGLLNTLNNTNLSRADYSKEAKFYDLAYGIAPIGISAEFPYLLGNQSIGIQTYIMLDCGDNKSDSIPFYANLVLSGPVTNSIYYNLATTLGAIDFKDFTNYTSFSLMVFPTQTISVNAGVDLGLVIDGNGYYSQLSTAAGGQITPRASFTYGTDKLCFDLGGKYILAYNGDSYEGISFDLNTGFVYNIFSDLQVGLSGTASFDTTEAKTNSYTVNLNIALAF